ncbi:MAG: ComEC/Rec2 family competence protein [Candidatus Blackburnbacteria bacterium]|nr:ComEC/Rec2 family competence protein [Candidatus Blackburnbacteria bacterium]
MRRYVPYFLISLTLIALYLIRFYTTRPSFKEGDRIRVRGTVQEDPVLIEGFPEFAYGDKVIMEGRAARGKGGWYLEEGKVSSLDFARDKQVSKAFLDLRERILGIFGEFLPEPHAALLKGIVLGTKTSLDSEFFEALRTTGTLHVVVASGANIAMFAGGLLGVLAHGVGRRRAVWPALAAVWIYVFLVGWQPAIVRAGIMGSVAFLAQATGKEFDAWRALFISAGAMLLLEPQWLFDVGFQLSFAATAGILAFSTRIHQLIVLIPRVIRENLATTLGAQIAVSPILFFNFGQISLISPLVNALVLWTVPFIMAGGMIVGALGAMWEPLGQVAAWFVWLPLEYFVIIIRMFS